jgi:hypothetical protein
MSAEGVKTIPECAECEVPWLPAAKDHWQAYLTDDEPPELEFYCPECAEREFGRAERRPFSGSAVSRRIAAPRSSS